MVGYAGSEEDFQTTTQPPHGVLLEYHQFCDICSDYNGVANPKAVNDTAGGAPVVVDRRIIGLLLFCRGLRKDTSGQVSVASGGVLALWHDAREAGVSDPVSTALPDTAALVEVTRHADFSSIITDEAVFTVQITNSVLRLNVGAIAEGYVVKRVCRAAPDGLLLNVGGSVWATGPESGDENQVVGIQAPDGESGAFLHTLYVRDMLVVTSGDYQRYRTVGGMRYHHIIDPAACRPAAYWRTVTVLYADSGLTGALFTALFTLPQTEGQVLLGRHGAEVMQMDASSGETSSPGFSACLRT